MKNAPNEKAAVALQAMENAITKAAAMLEIAAILRTPIGGDFITVGMLTLDGLNILAQEQGENLFNRFSELVEALKPQSRRKGGQQR